MWREAMHLRSEMISKTVKGLAAASALLLVAACSSTDTTATGAGSGASKPAQAPATQAAPPGSSAHFVAQVQDRVYFDFDSYSLDSEDRQALQQQAAWLKLYPQTTITVEGHCDERGTREYNLALGARRANAVKDYLINLGVDPARVRTISYGKERPVAPGSNEAAWRLNRRGVTVVSSPIGS